MKRSAVVIGLAVALAVGASALAQPTCAPTKPDAEGPFYKPGAPVREATGRGLVVSGMVKSAATCEPIKGVRVEWWQANPSGQYDDAHRGMLVTGENGAYRFDTDFPPPYQGRPSHIHFKAFAAGHRPLTTQLYLKGGQSAATFDLVLVKE
ncbi:MAG TPA: intradiol ring-cleavage dioxygenase [Methylomirabilota bacterium]|jgi:protocatechuate 3,4-dioxygenase beta subunit|nr:intradiol ring-cleavage dioxygenase [Methylomirabilota bacterium]